MAIELFLDCDGTLYGPYSPDELKELASNGRVRETDSIRNGRHGSPTPVKDVTGLLAEIKAGNSPIPKKPKPQASEKCVYVPAKSQPKPSTKKPESRPVPEVSPWIHPSGERTGTDGDTRSCPYCAEAIKKAAKKCRF